MWTPRTYKDFLDEGNDPILEVGHTGRPKCPGCGWEVPAPVIVDCRNIDVAFVEADWACSRCWVPWVKASGSPENMLAEIANQASGPGQSDKRNFMKSKGLAQSDEHIDFALEKGLNMGRANPDLRELLNEMKDKGFEVKTVRKHCFTVSQWMELHGAPERVYGKFRGKKTDFNP